ncbi:restriction endonuclease [Clostridium tertium]|uniref:restriction endonuclease n=1 Tax=Clostridium tertium TaxID=1559 RepID=UPI001AE7B0AA|nr:restriction endonuclease [Clostridium tertium]MBP1867247.1 restriction system protein [Clostridium tertium]
MGLPKYYEMHKPFLEYLKDGKLHTLKELKQFISKYFNLTEEELLELLPSGRQTVFINRIGWARTYLKKSGLIDSPARASFIITNDGLEVLKDNPDVIDSNYLMKFESFREFQGVFIDTKNNNETSNDINNTPDDTFEDSFRKINKSLAEDLLAEVIKLSPTAFEQMVIDLLSKMGYGSFENARKTTATTGDEGIDGIIMEDKLGFNLIYIQAKKWELNSKVGRPDVQSFVGAISGKGGKGLFVTTAKFSKQAIEYAKNQHIILIDGEKLSNLMIEHNFGVTVKKVFEIKAIDTDVFNEYLE